MTTLKKITRTAYWRLDFPVFVFSCALCYLDPKMDNLEILVNALNNVLKPKTYFFFHKAC